jgi:hypothetical protein
MARPNRLRKYEVEVRPGTWVTMKLTPEQVEEHGDPKRIREPKARPVANKGRQPANKSA